jgi:hypothetical protein
VTPAGLAPKTNTTAILAVFAGLFGSCFCGLGGVLAVVLGLAARGEIARSSGRESGSGLATAGIVLGGINLALVVLGIAVSIAMVARPGAIAGIAPPPAPPHAGVAPAPSAPGIPVPNPPHAAPFTRERGTRETAFGKIRVVDPSPGAVSLRTALAEQQKAARAEKETLLVFVVAPNCLPCNGVMLSLRDPRMQSALAGVRLVRLDASEFGAELLSLGVPTETVPGFALLGESLRPTDYVHGGEWDADVPANISPVLGPFVRGKYTTRRHRYREAARPDETAL